MLTRGSVGGRIVARVVRLVMGLIRKCRGRLWAVAAWRVLDVRPLEVVPVPRAP
jgi:hypothetical protein